MPPISNQPPNTSEGATTFLGIEEQINTNNCCIQRLSFIQLILMTLPSEVPQLSAAITSIGSQCLPGWGFACAMGLSALSSHLTYRKKMDQAELVYEKHHSLELSTEDLQTIKKYWDEIRENSKKSEETEKFLSCLYGVFSLATVALAFPIEVGLSQSGNVIGYESISILYSILGIIWSDSDAVAALRLAILAYHKNKGTHPNSPESTSITSTNEQAEDPKKVVFIFNRIMKEAKEAEMTRNAYVASFVATCAIATITTLLAAGTVATGGALPFILFTTYVVLSLASVTMRYLDIHNRGKDGYNYDHFTIRRVQDIGKSYCSKGHKKIIEEIIDKIKKLSQGNAIETPSIDSTQDSVPEAALSEKTDDKSSTEAIKNQSYVDIINRMEQGIKELKVYVDGLSHMKNPNTGVHSSFWFRDCKDKKNQKSKDFYNEMLFSILQTASNEILNESTPNTSLEKNGSSLDTINESTPNTSLEKNGSSLDTINESTTLNKNGSDTVVDKLFKGQDIDKNEFKKAYEEFKSSKNNPTGWTTPPNAPP